MSEPRVLPVTVDKSHLVTIGERLYTESIELVRELVNNAYDADATRVDVRIGAESIAVEDNGQGLTEDETEKVFDAFFTTKTHGLGIGLGLSRSIAESHGGGLWITRNAGRGVTARFILPYQSGSET